MAKKFRFGIIGCGMISDFHAAAIKDIPNAELVAVVDVREESARRLGEANHCAWYTSFKKFCKHDMDVVTICTPSGLHKEPALEVIKAGKHLIVEKPLEITLKRCDSIIEAADKARVKLATIFPSRWSDCNQLLKQAIDRKCFGRLTLGDVYVKWWRTQAYYDSGGWRGTWKVDGGGAMMNQSIHNVDLIQWFMGKVDSVMAMSALLAHKRIEVEDTAVAVLQFKNGALGVIEGTTSVFPGLLKKIEIHGDKGTAIVEQDDIIFWKFANSTPLDERVQKLMSQRKSGGGGASDPKAISHVGHRKQFEDFLKALETGGKPLIDGIEGRKSVEIILAIYKSAKTGKKIKL
ncbi:MAG: Gfo/Idh/MocA family oxidoreductase [Kiritimatiellae bacterium]|nr:Gfo/Idh/MocA family oxidoreductase [Kiritimatiellia bacterium]MDD5521522.1 Gfo/Idh/MocA family oxidoreductase [Kiritimatiellia bacterium]